MSDELKKRFLDRAKAQAEQPEFARSSAVTQLIGEARAFGVNAEGEIFEAAYGDPSGKLYWDAQLSEPIALVSLAYKLAAHGEDRSQEYVRAAIVHAFQEAAASGEPWFSGDTAPLLAIEPSQIHFGELGKIKVEPRPAIEWLLSKPMRRHLVPNSLRQHLIDVGPHNDAELPAGQSINNMPPENKAEPQARYPVNSITPEKQRRGRKPGTFERVKAAMSEKLAAGLTEEDLRNSPEKHLELDYGASRDTCRKARRAVLSERIKKPDRAG